mmetsp:Transcript_117731/g.204984  ORF Transcript_117731/g.204984 Transcript_117731/m.204984 type:complete len:359 (-) Transcript_117731:1647-2723(-)
MARIEVVVVDHQHNGWVVAEGGRHLDDDFGGGGHDELKLRVAICTLVLPAAMPLRVQCLLGPEGQLLDLEVSAGTPEAHIAPAGHPLWLQTANNVVRARAQSGGEGHTVRDQVLTSYNYCVIIDGPCCAAPILLCQAHENDDGVLPVAVHVHRNGGPGTEAVIQLSAGCSLVLRRWNGELELGVVIAMLVLPTCFPPGGDAVLLPVRINGLLHNVEGAGAEHANDVRGVFPRDIRRRHQPVQALRCLELHHYGIRYNVCCFGHDVVQLVANGEVLRLHNVHANGVQRRGGEPGVGQGEVHKHAARALQAQLIAWVVTPCVLEVGPTSCAPLPGAFDDDAGLVRKQPADADRGEVADQI